ncbi:AHH domain-containing protein [Allomuricauda taeanensis]|uniref:AHH domain-containing protein n=1 Tax=Flagellimonas taeanensis TaxID=1005926 RepID=UPI002E7BBCE6|nr:AHH domain-containing protein [Allomuricauda taeanensis]MEE1962931.1 AHH domain-containing protein [Allomuricauda taeanensis]
MLKATHLFKLSLCFILISLASCEQNSEGENSVISEIPKQEQNTQAPEITKVDFLSIPKPALDKLSSLNVGKNAQNGTIQISLGKVLTNSILQIKSRKTGNTNYTFPILPDENNIDVLFNLVLPQDSAGNFGEPYVIQYDMDSHFATELQSGNTGMQHFTGKMKRFFLNVQITLKNGGECPEDPVDDGNIGGGGTPVGGPGESDPDGPSNGDGLEYPCAFTTTFVKCCGSNKDIPHSATECGCSSAPTGSYYVTYVDCDSSPGGGSQSNKGNGAKMGGDCPEPDGEEGVINMYDHAIDILSTELALSSNQQNWLQENKSAALSFYGLYTWDQSETGKNALRIVMEMEMAGIHYSEVNTGFASIVNKYNSFDVQSQYNHIVSIWFTIRCAEIRALNPDWSEWRVAWEASKDFIHLSLDVVGLVPGVGEAADLVNGAIYYAEGDTLNGTLSLSAAIPFAGWVATGSKWAVKVTKLANGTKVALQMTKTADNLIDFGQKSSKLFREQLGLVPGDGMIGHHVIPWNMNNHPVVQAAAKYKWHPHDASINGKIVSYERHAGSHNAYDTYVESRLEGLRQYINNPERAYQELKKLSDELQLKIDTNPTKRINELY